MQNMYNFQMNVDELSGRIQIIYRIYYKVTKIDYNYKALRSSTKLETILVEANLRKSFVQIPKRLSHEELVSKILEEWILENIIEEPKIYNTQIREIVQEGTYIRLKINRSSSVKIRNLEMITINLDIQ